MIPLFLSYEASVIQAGDTVVGRVNVHIDLKESSANCTVAISYGIIECLSYLS